MRNGEMRKQRLGHVSVYVACHGMAADVTSSSRSQPRDDWAKADDKLIRTPVQSRENLWYYQHYGLFTITRKWRLAYAIETHLADPSKIYRLLDTLRNGLVSQIRLSSTISLRLLHEQLQSTTEVQRNGTLSISARILTREFDTQGYHKCKACQKDLISPINLQRRYQFAKDNRLLYNRGKADEVVQRTNLGESSPPGGVLSGEGVSEELCPRSRDEPGAYSLNV
ncbi:hypothetical protein V498_09000 [Pseudogymnoascus sp. VKM F-4517 (FW-2822)]|nr:hypothetical protein V498_09000 [Pseudogymnoascus sp. VKM F-4517 (FW-2822)]